MDKNLLPKGFFKNHPLDRVSSAIIADYTATIAFNDGIHAELEKIVGPEISDERHAQIERDKLEIEALNTGEAVESYMRKKHDNLTDPLFFKKALTLVEDAAPLILKRFKTTGQDRFVELTFRILVHADKRYTEQLLSEYQEIRNPYAQAVACLLFGEHNMEETVPLLLKEYERFKKNYPDENLNQFPLLALYILYGET